MLRLYAGADVSAPPPNAQQDFAQAAQHAPPEHLASGLTAAFQSNETPPFPQMLSQLSGPSNGQQRAGILSEFLSTAGPTLGGGLLQQFSGLLHGGTVTLEQAQQVSPLIRTTTRRERAAARSGPLSSARVISSAQHPQRIET